MQHDYSQMLGLGISYPFEEKTYYISDDLSFGVSAALERWLKREAILSAQDGAGSDPDEMRAMRETFFDKCQAGEYRLEGAVARKAILNNPEATVELLYLLLEDGKRKHSDQPPVSRELARKMLMDETAAPWLNGVCLVALGLDPTSALAAGMGVAQARAIQKKQQAAVMSRQELSKEFKNRLASLESGDESLMTDQQIESRTSSRNVLNLLIAYLG